MDEDDSTFLISQAQRCRRLAQAIGDARARETLSQLADDYETRAKRIQEHRMEPTGHF